MIRLLDFGEWLPGHRCRPSQQDPFAFNTYELRSLGAPGVKLHNLIVGSTDPRYFDEGADEVLINLTSYYEVAPTLVFHLCGRFMQAEVDAIFSGLFENKIELSIARSGAVIPDRGRRIDWEIAISYAAADQERKGVRPALTRSEMERAPQRIHDRLCQKYRCDEAKARAVRYCKNAAGLLQKELAEMKPGSAEWIRTRDLLTDFELKRID